MRSFLSYNITEQSVLYHIYCTAHSLKMQPGGTMKTQRNILIAFLLNLGFSIFEFFGGMFTGSVAILSDALHDLGDAMSIGISYFLERKSKKKPDALYTFGYGRFSVLGGLITSSILLFGSVAVAANAMVRLFNPTPIRYNGMILFAIVGALVNLIAAFVTREGDSINQKAVNLHMLGDVLGWIVVLLGAIVMKFTDLAFLDPLLCICVAVYIFIHAAKTMKQIADLFLEKAPEDVSVFEIREHLMEIPGVLDVHHIHLRSMDGYHNSATMHIVTDRNHHEVKAAVRQELQEHGIEHSTLELEDQGEVCSAPECSAHTLESHHHHHGHHHH